MSLGEGMEDVENEMEAGVAVDLRNLGREETLGEEQGFMACLGVFEPGTGELDLFREAL